MKILAIESSCDETAASVIKTDGSRVQILSNIISSQTNIHRKFGGVFPEHASRAHAEKIISVIKSALQEAGLSPSAMPVEQRFNSHSRTRSELKAVNRLDRVAGDEEISRGKQNNLDLIAVTTGPGLVGSLLIGVNFAKTFAYVNNLPILGINHWLGHIYSNWAEKPYPEFPALILIVSGGHTGLVLMKSHHEIIPLGETLDDAAGEAFDKVAKLLGLGYPGGPAISKAAETGNSQSYNFPRSMLDKKNYNFSFSGLKTAVLYESKKNQEISAQKKADFAASFQQTVVDILVGKTIKAAYEYKPKSICLCGGVSANKQLREQMKKAVAMLPWKASYHVPPMILSTDNAAMIGLAAAYHLDQKTTWDKINADANLSLAIRAKK